MRTTMLFPSRHHALSMLAAITAVCTTHAEVFEIKAGDDWSKLSPTLVAGDELVLLEGVHVPAQFSGLVGEPTAPIVIRSHDKGRLAEIAAGREGLRLTNCRHVRVERLLVKNARRAGVVIDAIDGGVSADITIEDTRVSGVGGLVEQSGVLVIGTHGFALRRSRIEQCIGAALRFENCEGSVLERLQLQAPGDRACEFGVVCLGETHGLSADDLSLSGNFAVGVSVGAKDAPRAPKPAKDPAGFEPVTAPRPGATESIPTRVPDSPPQPALESSPNDAGQPTQALATQINLTNLLIRGAERALEFGSCTQVQVTNTTVIDPSNAVLRLVRLGGGRPDPELRFQGNIVSWQAGGLRQLVETAGGSASAGLLLGPNIWWSKELPAALPNLGPEGNPFSGTTEVPQTIDIDPALDSRGRPAREEARMYGRNL